MADIAQSLSKHIDEYYINNDVKTFIKRVRESLPEDELERSLNTTVKRVQESLPEDKAFPARNTVHRILETTIHILLYKSSS